MRVTVMTLSSNKAAFLICPVSGDWTYKGYAGRVISAVAERRGIPSRPEHQRQYGHRKI